MADDALTGVRYLQTRPEIDAKRIGLQGNSNSAWAVTIAAARSKDVAFAVIGSGGAVTPAEAENHEAASWLRANKFSEEEVTHAVNLVKAKWKYAQDGANWIEYEALAKKAQTKKWFAVINGPLTRDTAAWQGFQAIAKHEPGASIETLTQPLLILFGEPERDQIVPVKQAAAEWERLLKKSGHQDFTIRTINGVGHALFFREEQGRTVIAPEPFALLGEWWAKRK